MKRALGGLLITAMLCLACACQGQVIPAEQLEKAMNDVIPDAISDTPYEPFEIVLPSDIDSPTDTTKPTAAPTTASTTAAPTTQPTTTTTTVANRDQWNGDNGGVDRGQTLNGILVIGNTAYEYYAFSQSAADTYVAAINRAVGSLCRCTVSCSRICMAR